MSMFVFNPFTNKLDIAEDVVSPPGTVAFLEGDTGGSIGPDGGGVIYIQGNQIGNLGAITFAGTAPSNIYASVICDNTTIAINPTGQLSVINGGNSFEDKNANFTAVTDMGYFCTPGAGITATLPAAPIIGSLVMFIVDGPNFVVQANVGQFIQMSSVRSASGGTATNTLSGDSITLRYRDSDRTWYAESFNGSWNLA